MAESAGESLGRSGQEMGGQAGDCGYQGEGRDVWNLRPLIGQSWHVIRGYLIT